MTIQQMSLEEESSLILEDVFADDNEAQTPCIMELAALHGKDYSSMSEEDIQDMIIEYEDDLYALYDDYLKAE